MRRLLTKYVLLLFALLLSVRSYAQTNIEQPNLAIPSRIAPAYFGPNAFPVPDMLDGRTSSELKLELYGDCFLGTTTGNVADDITGDLFAKLTIPLFTPKANLTVWMPIFEYFHTSAELNAMRRLPAPYNTTDLQGMDSGDVYISADIRILNQEKHHVDITARAALKTASANEFAEGRCYDAPGYFFDAAIGRGFDFSRGGGFCAQPSRSDKRWLLVLADRQWTTERCCDVWSATRLLRQKFHDRHLFRRLCRLGGSWRPSYDTENKPLVSYWRFVDTAYASGRFYGLALPPNSSGCNIRLRYPEQEE